jgi:hypothetical protein
MRLMPQNGFVQCRVVLRTGCRSVLASGSVVVKALCYKPEGRGFLTR